MTEHPDIPVTSGPAPVRPVAWWMLLLVALVAAGAYANSLYNGYAFDDLAIVKNNPHVVDRQWTTIWTDNYWPRNEGILPDALYRPLTLWTYLANQALAPDSPGPFHVVNVALHTLVSVLVCLLAWRLLGHRVVALVAGILFAVHPLHTEVVANIVGRAELLATLWSLLVLLVFLPKTLLGQDSPPVIATRMPLLQVAMVGLCAAIGALAVYWMAPGLAGNYFYGGTGGTIVGLFTLCFGTRGMTGMRSRWHGFLVGACFFAAVLCKETPATLILALPLIDLWRWTRWSPGTRPRWWLWLSAQAVRYYAPMAAFAGVYLVLRVRACGLMGNTQVIHHIVNPLVEATALERVVTPFTLLGKYLYLTFWPVHLSADYSSPSILPTTSLIYYQSLQPPAILGVLACALAVLLCVLAWRKLPQIILLVGLFIVSYLLVANIIRIGTIFGERLFYWPSVFVLILIAWAAVGGFQAVVRRIPKMGVRLVFNTAGFILLAIPVGLMARRTWIRNTDWADNIALAISTARDNPGSGKACSWAGATLAVTDNPDYVAFGKTLIDRAIELSPDYVSARWELAKYYGMHGQLGESAIRVAQVVRFDPGTHLTRTAIPALIEDLRQNQTSTYMPVIEGYLKEHPDEDAANLAMAFALHAQDDLDKAAVYARKAIELGKGKRPDGFDQFHEAGAELATVQFEKAVKDSNRAGIEQALKEFRIYTTYMHNSVEAHCAFASMLLSLDPKKYPEALGEAQFNITYAGVIEAGNSRVRDLQGRLNVTRLASTRAATSTASVLPDTSPIPNGGVGP